MPDTMASHDDRVFEFVDLCFHNERLDLSNR